MIRLFSVGNSNGQRNLRGNGQCCRINGRLRADVRYNEDPVNLSDEAVAVVVPSAERGFRRTASCGTLPWAARVCVKNNNNHKNAYGREGYADEQVLPV